MDMEAFRAKFSNAPDQQKDVSQAETETQEVRGIDPVIATKLDAALESGDLGLAAHQFGKLKGSSEPGQLDEYRKRAEPLIITALLSDDEYEIRGAYHSAQVFGLSDAFMQERATRQVAISAVERAAQSGNVDDSYRIAKTFRVPGDELDAPALQSHVKEALLRYLDQRRSGSGSHFGGGIESEPYAAAKYFSLPAEVMRMPEMLPIGVDEYERLVRKMRFSEARNVDAEFGGEIVKRPETRQFAEKMIGDLLEKAADKDKRALDGARNLIEGFSFDDAVVEGWIRRLESRLRSTHDDAKANRLVQYFGLTQKKG